MLRKSLAFVVVALLLAAGASAQSVGLVLSGGGAKGLYHIGVIQALEENEIPIDYVAGTSMGSIIAALYAAGYSPEEMRAIVDSGQVREWVSGRIDSRYASYYRQMQDQPSMLTLRLNLRDEEKRSDAKNKSRLVLPSHLISSSQIDLALAELLTPASTASGGDFDRLMVPFRCVASDLVARKPYVLKTGDLGEAVRASMAIPLAFNPIEKDSMLLYDGGIYDNFPWKPLDETFRPDYLIGSKCTSGNTEPNAKSIMDQVWMLTMEKTDYDMPAGRSTLIERAVDVSMLDFSQADAIIQSGYDDTMALMDSLKSAVPRRMSRGEALRRRAAFRERCPELLFNRYAIEGLNPAQTTYVRDNMQLDHQHDGEPKILSFERVKDKYFSVLADGNFSTEYPYMRYDPKSGYYGIDFRLTTKPDYKILIGGNISSTAFNQAYVGFEYHRIRHAANRYYTHLFLGPVSSAVMLGGRTDFFLWRPLFVDYSYNFTARNYKNGNFGNLTSVSNTESMKFLENFLSLGFGFPVTHRSAFVIRLNGGQERYYYSLDRASYKENYYEDHDHAQLHFAEDRAAAQFAGQDDLPALRYVALAVGHLSLRPRPFRAESLFARRAAAAQVEAGCLVVGRPHRVEPVFPDFGQQMVFAGLRRRGCRDDDPHAEQRQGDAHADAGLPAYAPFADGLHARIPRQALCGGQRDADLRFQRPVLPADGHLRDVRRAVPTDRRQDALHRRRVAGLSYGHRPDQPLADEVQRQELGQPLPDLQFRLCDVPSARNPLLTTLWFNDSTTI